MSALEISVPIMQENMLPKLSVNFNVQLFLVLKDEYEWTGQ